MVIRTKAFKIMIELSKRKQKIFNITSKTLEEVMYDQEVTISEMDQDYILSEFRGKFLEWLKNE